MNNKCGQISKKFADFLDFKNEFFFNKKQNFVFPKLKTW